MPTLTIPNVPETVFAALADRAARAKRTVEEEALSLIEKSAGERLSEPLELIPSPEIPAPFDLDPPGPVERVKVRDIQPPPPEFWFDEDKGIG